MPAATPGQALASVYQQVRVWSVQTVYGQLTSQVRAVTSSTPLYYYFGGHIGNGADIANIPDVFFSLAKQYTVTVIEDAAQSPGLALLFGSMGRAYGVQVAMEWTAPNDNTQLAAQAVQWIDNYGMTLPTGGGEDFFIHEREHRLDLGALRPRTGSEMCSHDTDTSAGRVLCIVGYADRFRQVVEAQRTTSAGEVSVTGKAIDE